MKKRSFAIITIIFLSIILGYQLIDLINYVFSPQAISYDDTLEKPQVLDSEGHIITPHNYHLHKERLQKGPEQDVKIEGDKNKPIPKNKFLNVMGVAENEYRYSKEDYDGEIQKSHLNTMNLESNWERKILESETLIEKSLQQVAQKNPAQMGALSLQPLGDEKNMERFAIKIELPDVNEGAKFKLQYREPPSFGKENVALPANLQHTDRPNAAFSIEKTTAPNSPWDNFSGPR